MQVKTLERGNRCREDTSEMNRHTEGDMTFKTKQGTKLTDINTKAKQNISKKKKTHYEPQKPRESVGLL